MATLILLLSRFFNAACCKGLLAVFASAFILSVSVSLAWAEDAPVRQVRNAAAIGGDAAVPQELLDRVAEIQSELLSLFNEEVEDAAYTGSFHQWLSAGAVDPESPAHTLLRELEETSEDLAQLTRGFQRQGAAPSRPRPSTLSEAERSKILSLREELSDMLQDYQRDAPSLSDAERVARWEDIRGAHEKVRSLQEGRAQGDRDTSDLSGDDHE